jgi:rubrerythrin
MAGIFKAGDIIRAAEQIEMRGEAFYQRLVDAMAGKDSAACEMFAYLRDEEARHREVFRAMGVRLAPVELPAWAGEEEYMTYMRAMLDDHALFRSEGAGAVQHTREEAIRMAMQFEKDTMLFFFEMRELVPVDERTVIDRCVEEERGHLKELTRLLV